MEDEVLKTLETKSGNSYILKPNHQTTETDIIDLHNLIAQLLVDDYIEQQQKTTDN